MTNDPPHQSSNSCPRHRLTSTRTHYMWHVEYLLFITFIRTLLDRRPHSIPRILVMIRIKGEWCSGGVLCNIRTFWSTVHDKHHVTILTHYSLLYILIFNHTLKYQCEFIVVFIQWLPNIVYWTSGFDLFVCASTNIIWAASTKSSSRNHHDVSGILLHTESIILHVFNMLSNYTSPWPFHLHPYLRQCTWIKNIFSSSLCILGLNKQLHISSPRPVLHTTALILSLRLIGEGKPAAT